MNPQYDKKKINLPVMVWIHGGALYTGSGTDGLYPPDNLLDHDIILVSPNYRLGNGIQACDAFTNYSNDILYVIRSIRFLELGSRKLPRQFWIERSSGSIEMGQRKHSYIWW